MSNSELRQVTIRLEAAERAMLLKKIGDGGAERIAGYEKSNGVSRCFGFVGDPFFVSTL